MDLMDFIGSFSLQSNIIVNIISPGEFISRQYVHWNFAVSHALYKEIVFIHDDEIYNAELLDIARAEFSEDADVTLVTGGQINVHPSASDFRVFRTVRFEERKVYEPRAWLEFQRNQSFPKFGATVYIFRRLELNYWFLEKNVRISDALLIYQLALRGKVIERPEYFGTHLQHAGNTALNEYLNVGHVPYWAGLCQLGELENERKLIDASNCIKKEAIRTYSRNALCAALPKGDHQGWNECLRQCELAGGKPEWLVRLINSLPMKWIILPPVARAAKLLFHKVAPNSGRGKLTGERVDLKECLGLTDAVVDDFKSRAASSAGGKSIKPHRI